MTLYTEPETSKARAQRRRAPWVALVLLVGLMATMSGIFPFRQIIAQHRQVDLTEQKLATIQEENRRLEGQIELLETPIELERIAREQLGVVRPGETAIVVGSDVAATVVPNQLPGAIVPERDEGRSIPEKVWDFLTGSDLVSDG